MIGFVCNSENATSQFYLAHHGVDGQQWGQRNGPPYPLNKGGKLSLLKQRMAKRKQQKLEKKQEKIRKAQEEKERRFKEEKEKVKTSGTATEVLKYKGKWNNEELQYISNRLRLESELAGYSAKETKTAMDKINSASRTMETMSKFADSGISLWNSFAKIYNAGQIKRKDLKSEHLLPVVGKNSNDLIRSLVKEENSKSGKSNDNTYGLITKRANPYKGR